MANDAHLRAATGGSARTPNKLNVFISYSRQDIAFVDLLRDRLRADGIEAFVDREHIEKSEEWWARIKQLIIEADTVVFVLSPGSIDSTVCKDEVEFAEKLNKRIVPIVARDLEGRKVPEALALFNYIYFFPNPTAGATGEFEAAAVDLARTLGTHIPWIREHTRLGVIAERWEARKRPDDLLLRGAELNTAETWLITEPDKAPDPTDAHRALINLSRQAVTRKNLSRVRLAIGIGALVCIAAVISSPSFMLDLIHLDHWTADWRTAIFSRQAPASGEANIAIVAINDDTLKGYSPSPIDRGLLAKIVQKVDAAGAKAIGINVLFLKETEPTNDRALLEAVREAKAKIILGAVDERGELLPFQRDFQRSYLAAAQRPAGYFNLRHDGDAVVRNMAGPALNSAFPKSFALLLAQAGGGPINDTAGKPIAWLLPPANGAEVFRRVLAQDLLTASGPAHTAVTERLKGRIVLVGGDFQTRDRHRTPLSVVYDDGIMPGVLVHAYIVADLLDPTHDISEPSPVSTQIMLGLLAVAGFALGWGSWRSVLVSLAGWGFASAVLVAIDAFCFVELQLLLPFTLALVAWVAGLTAGRSLHFAMAR